MSDDTRYRCPSCGSLEVEAWDDMLYNPNTGDEIGWLNSGETIHARCGSGTCEFDGELGEFDTSEWTHEEGDAPYYDHCSATGCLEPLFTEDGELCATHESHVAMKGAGLL